MSQEELTLEYLKVLLSAPAMAALVVLIFIYTFREAIDNIFKNWRIRLPGGTEITSQQAVSPKERTQPDVDPSEVPTDQIPQSLTDDQRKSIVNLIRSLTANARLWEYRYLNYFLVRTTQMVLDWLIGLESPTTQAQYDAVWLPVVIDPDQRNNILDALRTHHLIEIDNSTGLIHVTPKGKEYHEWRGALS